jgi:hypothetical protein
MKNLAIGCVGLLVLGIAGIAAVPYVLSCISGTVTVAAEGFVAEREQVERLVQQALRTRLGLRAADLERRASQMPKPGAASLRRRHIRRPAPAASPAAKDLVEPHRGVLERNVALASYGL